VTVGQRAALGEAAVRAARSVGYESAGTVEFLLAPSGEFYFLEMNTRIQVEHPVTEMVYGVDLVRQQLRIAAGAALAVPQPLAPRGHAIECRLTSEDPFQGFLPSTGRVEFLRPPGGPGVRWDSGIEEGSEVGLYYDPLLAKLIVWGENRDQAIRRMGRALEELVVVGVRTSQPLHRRIMADGEFQSGQYDVGYLERAQARLLEPTTHPEELELLAVAAALAAAHVPLAATLRGDGPTGAGRAGGWLYAARREALR